MRHAAMKFVGDPGYIRLTKLLRSFGPVSTGLVFFGFVLPWLVEPVRVLVYWSILALALGIRAARKMWVRLRFGPTPPVPPPSVEFSDDGFEYDVGNQAEEVRWSEYLGFRIEGIIDRQLVIRRRSGRSLRIDLLFFAPRDRGNLLRVLSSRPEIRI